MKFQRKVIGKAAGEVLFPDVKRYITETLAFLFAESLNCRIYDVFTNINQ